jgi:hypothetical protein
MLDARFRGHDGLVGLKGTLEIPSFLRKRESSGIDCKLTHHSTGLPKQLHHRRRRKLENALDYLANHTVMLR